MADRQVVRLYENVTILSGTNTTGISTQTFQALEGSRMLITLFISSVDLGASVNLKVEDSFNEDLGYTTVLDVTGTTVGFLKRTVVDYNALLKITVTATGGNASFNIGIRLFEDTDRLSNGRNSVAVNSDGSINVVGIISDSVEIQSTSVFAEALSVPSATPTTVVQYIIPVGKSGNLWLVDFGGQNIGTFSLTLNGTVIAKRRTWFNGSGLSDQMDFRGNSTSGKTVIAGDELKLIVFHNRPYVGDFEGRFQFTLIDV